MISITLLFFFSIETHLYLLDSISSNKKDYKNHQLKYLSTVGIDVIQKIVYDFRNE
jgi:hypothetical protein